MLQLKGRRLVLFVPRFPPRRPNVQIDNSQAKCDNGTLTHNFCRQMIRTWSMIVRTPTFMSGLPTQDQPEDYQTSLQTSYIGRPPSS